MLTSKLKQVLVAITTITLVLGLVPTQSIAEAMADPPEERIESDEGTPAGGPIEEVAGEPPLEEADGDVGGQLVENDSVPRDPDEAISEGEGSEPLEEISLETQAAEDVLNVTGTYDKDEQFIVWTIAIEVPATGYSSATLTNTYASAVINGETHREPIEMYYDVSMDEKDVYFDIEQFEDRFILNFYKDEDNSQIGIVGTGKARTVEVEVFTYLDQDWYDASVDDTSLADHVCEVKLATASGSFSATGVVTLQKPKCEHDEQRTYTQLNGENRYTLHHWACPICDQKGDEQHSYEEDASGTCTCSKCGQKAVRITFEAGANATGSMATVYREVGSAYKLPFHAFNTPEGQWFNMWKVEAGSAQSVLMNAGETINLTANVVLTALWNVSVPFIDDNDNVRYVNSYMKLRGTETQLQGSTSEEGTWFVADGSIDAGHTSIAVTGNVNLILTDGSTYDCGGLVVGKDATLHVWGQQVGDGALVRSNGTAITNRGTTYVHGGKITGSSTGISSEDAALVLHGGSVTGNAHGVTVVSGTVAVGHRTQVSGNGANDQDDNLRLSSTKTIGVDMPLLGEARIGVTIEGMTSGTFTSGYGKYNDGKDPTTYFFSSDPNAEIAHQLTNDEASLSTTASYVDESGELAYREDWHPLSQGMEEIADDGWYVVQKSMTLNSRLKVSKHARIILCDGCTLTCSQGIYVAGTLSVYCQQKGTGTLIAQATTQDYAGIGGNKTDNGTVNIYGGTVKAVGAKYGAGIGGGNKHSGGTINIYGGTVTATSGAEAAAIGGGNDHGQGGTITIYGGAVTATAKGQYGSGIGGGDQGRCGTVTIEGGTVTATGARFGAGIGSGDEAGSNDGTIIISGGDVKAYGGDEAAGIGGGNEVGAGTIEITGRGTTVLAKGACTNNMQYGAGIGGGDSGGGGDITISGGARAEAYAAQNKSGQAIGHGHGTSKSPRLTIDSLMAVANDVSVAQADERWTMCEESKHVIVYLCDHSDGAVTPTSDGLHHAVRCVHCDAPSFGESLVHEYDNDGLCACGLHRYEIVLEPGAGFGEAQTSYVYERVLYAGVDYTLPSADENPFSPPADNVELLSWLVNGVVHGRGETITLRDDAVIVAMWNTPWQKLQRRIYNANDGATIKLLEDTTAHMTEQPITIPEDKTITLDLAGFTLDRGLRLEASRTDGNVVCNKGTLTIKGGGKITGGNAKGDGGGIYSTGYLRLDGVTVSGNLADGSGGGVALCGASRASSITDSTISSNEALSMGGGVYVNKATLELKDTVIEDNSAERGGGVFNNNQLALTSANVLHINGGSFLRNKATEGGAYYDVQQSWTEIKDGVLFDHNMATKDGGALWVFGHVELEDAIISNNEALRYGGGAHAHQTASILLNDTQVTDNKAGENGGGIYVDGKDVIYRIEGAPVVTGNKAGGIVSNLYIPRGVTLQSQEGVVPEARMGITMEETPEVGRPIKIMGSGVSDSCFASDNDSYTVGLRANGDVVLGVTAKVSFDVAGGSGVMEVAAVPSGGVYELPSCDFAGPEGRTFEGWLVGNAQETVDAGTTIDVTNDITVTARWKALWVSLQQRIDEAKNGATITLGADTKAGPKDSAIVIAEGKTVTLDLAGHTLDRRLADANPQEGGSVILNDGTLTLTGGGAITGGHTGDKGGGIYNSGTLVIDGANVSGNAAGRGGGGVYNSGTLTMRAGEIRDNATERLSGGGIYNTGSLVLVGGSITDNWARDTGGGVQQDGQMSVSGTPNVTGNVRGAKGFEVDNNVYLPRAHPQIEIAGELDKSANLGVVTETLPSVGSSVVFTSGLQGNGDPSVFASDMDEYLIGTSEDGEALLGTPITVRFDAAGGKGVMANAAVPSDSWWEIPACEFTADEGGVFSGWLVDDETSVRWPGQHMKVTDDLNLKATWEDESVVSLPSFRTVSLVLSGRIGVSFFADLRMLTEEEREACFVTFEVCGEAHDVPYDIEFTDVKTGRYSGFTCFVSSVQMADLITATLHYGRGRSIFMNYRVEEYIKYIENHKSLYNDETIELARSLADYGHYAQPYLSAENGWVIGEDHAEMKTHFTDSFDASAVKDGLTAYTCSKDLAGTKIASASAHLYLNSGTAVEVFLKPATGEALSVDDVEASFAAGGKEPIVTLCKDGRLSVRIDNVSAHQLGVPVVISSSGKQIVTFSALSYASIVLGDNSGISDEGKELMCALYKFHEATIALRQV